MMNTRLCVFTSQLGASFIDRHVRDLCPGHTVAVARYGGHPLGQTLEPPCPVYFLDRWALGIPVRLARRAGVSEARLRDATVASFLRRQGVTVVLGEFLDQFLDFIPLLARMGLPYVVQGHGIDISAALRHAEMAERYQSYRSARAILTRCEFHRQRLIKIGLPADRIHVNPGGVDIPYEVPQRGFDAGTRFLAIGVMVPQKAPILLLEAFRLAATRNPDITLDFVGGGPLLPAALQFVRACGLSDRVRMHGIASEELKKRLLLECGVFVQHSVTVPETGDEEGLPAAIQEAMAHGLAVVSTRHSGIPEAVADGETGVLVDEGDVGAMAEAFLRITSTASVLGEAGRRRAAANFAWDHEKSRLQRWLFD